MITIIIQALEVLDRYDVFVCSFELIEELVRPGTDYGYIGPRADINHGPSWDHHYYYSLVYYCIYSRFSLVRTRIRRFSG